VKVRFWGTRGSIAKPGPSTVRYGGNTSCVELRTSDGTLIIFDCGTGAHELGRELVAREATATRGHILISHTHWDHIQGIPFFEPFFKAGGEWDVYGPKGLLQSIRDTLAGQMEYTYFPITVDKFGATIRYHDLVEGAFSIGAIQVVTQYLNHPALTLGYRVHADGATLVYCCDHEPNLAAAAAGEAELTGQDLRHAEFLAGADLVIHDSQFTASEYPDRTGWGHSPAEYVVKVCQTAGVGRVVLTHHDPMRDDDGVDRIVASLRQRAAGSSPPLEIIGAAEGRVIEVMPSLRGATGAATGLLEAHAAIDAISLKRPVLLQIADEQIGSMLREALSLEGLPDAILPQEPEQLRALSGERYSLALIQHDPPAIDGLEIARRMRAAQGDSTAPILPVVLVSSDPALAAHQGNAAMDWLIAPFSLSYARTKLRYWTLRLACRWVPANRPDDEAQRLATLYQLAVLDTPPEERFDRITRIAAATFNVPIALISLVDKDRQWFKSCVGINVSETPRDISFCAHAVELHADVIVSDTLLDDRFADNPLVVSGPRVRFYAGAPLLLKSGVCLGTLCIVDTRPRQLGAADIASLHDLRDMALEQLLKA
jgi:phosphoribosyl 1,2-cyclic phosphodiesterase/DNA-binding response OmpR family regulator